MTPSTRFAGLLALLALIACSPPEPVRIGFIGGLSGRVADLGIAGRNGAALAIEQRNAAGGIGGRPVELITEDDAQDDAVARSAMRALLDRRVEVVIGPMTSSVAMAIVPLANEAGVPLISPTVTTTALSGLDDQFLRVAADTRSYARKGATYHFSRLGLRRIAAIYDKRNQAYADSWLADYRAALATIGGELIATTAFGAGDNDRFRDLARNLLAHRADGVLIVANSVDTALLAQQLRKLDARIPINAAEWAATERLIELGGRAVEGMVVAQFVDRQSTAPAWRPTTPPTWRSTRWPRASRAIRSSRLSWRGRSSPARRTGCVSTPRATPSATPT